MTTRTSVRLLATLLTVTALGVMRVMAQNPVTAAREASQQAAVAQATGPAKVDAQVLVMGEPNLQFSVSPKGQHLAAVVLRGSRQVMVHDGVDGPRFDEVLLTPGGEGTQTKIVWSEDGSRYAYFGRVGQEYVIVVDGKEASRGPWSARLAQVGMTPVDRINFTPGSKHWYHIVHTEEQTGNPTYQLFIDGKPGPLTQGEIIPTWSRDGEHHAYVATSRTLKTPQTYFLVIDGRQAAYSAGEPQFTGDSLHLFTKRPVAGTNAIEVLADGASFMRANDVRLHMAPSGPGVLGVVAAPEVNSIRTYFLTVGNRRVMGSDCKAGIRAVFQSADARHWAIACSDSPSSYWVMADGRKGQDYQGVSNVVFTADGRAVYQGGVNGKYFLIVGDQESDGYSVITPVTPQVRGAQNSDIQLPAVVQGNHIAFVGRRAPQGFNDVVVVDGKPIAAVNPLEVGLSPDGSRFVFISGQGNQFLTVDGVAYPQLTVDPAMRNIGLQGSWQWTPDSRHVAWLVANTAGGPGIAIDGKFVATPGVPRYLTFTADGRHLVWLVRQRGAPLHAIFVDGVQVLEVPTHLPLENQADVYWGRNADGSLTFIAQDGDAMKRFRITPGTATSVDTLLSKAAVLR